MDAQALEEIRQNLEAADFLSDVEKEMFFDILPSWPEGNFQELLEALREGGAPVPKSVSPVQASVPKPTIARSDKVAEGARVEDLRKFLSSKTVSFKAEKPVAPAVATAKTAAPQAPHKVTVEDVLKPPPPINDKRVATPVKLPPQAAKPAPEAPRGFFRPIKIDDLSTSEDLSRLTLNHLRQGDFNQNLKKIVDKIIQIAQKESVLPYTVIQSFLKSPVNELFIETGLALMDDISKDRTSVFARIENVMKNEHKLAFNSEEFHAFTDFKTELDKLF